MTYTKTKLRDFRIWCKIDGEITSKRTKAIDKAHAAANLLSVFPKAEVGHIELARS